MSDERIDAEVASVLRRALPSADPAWEARAISAVQVAQRAQLKPMRRTVAVAISVSAVLIGLGFVPIPMGEAPGALARAQAAMQRLQSFHTVIRTSYNDRTGRMEEWWSADGFHRMDMDWDEGWRQSVEVDDPHGRLRYDRFVRNQEMRQVGSIADHAARTPTHYSRPVFPAERSSAENLFTFIRNTKGWTVSEQRERSLWFGATDVLEAQGVERQGYGAFPITYAGGDTHKYRAELEPDTGRLLALVEYVLSEDGQWERTYWTEVLEWDVAIPESVREFQFPPGTTVTERRWWTGRTERVIAQADTVDWIVKLHSIDVNRRGDLYVTLSRWLKPESGLRESLSCARMQVDAIDEFGGKYTQSYDRTPVDDVLCDGPTTERYTTVILRAQASGAPQAVPRRLTLTVHPYPRGDRGEQFMLFPDVARPGLGNGDELFREGVKTVRH